MSQIVDRIQNHQIRTNIASAVTALETIEQRRGFDDQYAKEVVDRAIYVLNMCLKVIDSTDPYIISTQTLDTISSTCNSNGQIVSQINAFISNGNIGHLHNIDSSTNVIVQNIAAISIPKTTEDVATLREAITSFRRSMISQLGRSVKATDEFIEKINEKILEIDKQSDDQIAIVSNEVSSLKDQVQSVSDDVKRELEGLNTEKTQILDQWSSSLEEKVSEFDTKFAAHQELIESSLQTCTTSMATMQENELQVLKDNIESFMQEEQKKIKNLWEYLETKKREVEVLAGQVAVSSMAGHYKKIADRESESEVLWKRVTTVVFLVWFITTCINAYLVSGATFSLGVYLPKVAVELVMVSFLWFCLRQITVHRKHERYNRQISLELASLEPYIATLGDETAKEIKKALADKLFGRAEQMIGVSTSDDKPSLVDKESFEVILKLLDKVKK